MASGAMTLDEPMLHESEALGDGVHLLVAMPALNEGATIGEVIRNIPRTIPGIAEIDVVVVDDGSTDDTVEKARAAGADVLSHPRNRGVGAAFHSILEYGIDHGADLIATLDSDGQFDPREIPTLIAPVLSGTAQFATASRFKDPSLVPEMSAIKKWGNAMMSRLISGLIGERFYDVSCGMRCYSREAALQLHLVGTFTYTQEVFLNLAFKGVPMVEVPIRVRGRREHGKSRVASNLFHYALRTSQIILRCYRDYFPLRFFGRLAAAVFIVGSALGAFFAIHYFRVGRFSPHLWAGFSAAACFALTFALLHLGVLGDMMARHRLYMEEILYRQRGLGARLDSEALRPRGTSFLQRSLDRPFTDIAEAQEQHRRHE